jgi:hypothetical protein
MQIKLSLKGRGDTMTYIRKTKDEYILLGNYGMGYEEVVAEDTYKEIRQRLREYIENEPIYSFKLKKRRVKK